MLAQTINNLHTHYTAIPPKEKSLMTPAQHRWFRIRGYIGLGIHKAMVVLLMGHSLVGLYEASLFVLVDFPNLERQFTQHTITAQELNETVAQAIIALIGTSLMIFLAVRLSIVREKVAHIIDITMGFIVILGRSYLIEYIVAMGFIDISRFLN